MIRYKCAKCGSLLESDDIAAGKTDRCPTCGEVCSVPQLTPSKTLRRTLIGVGGLICLAIGITVALLIWLRDGSPRTQPDERAANVSSDSATSAGGEAVTSLPKYEVLAKSKPSSDQQCWVLADIMTRRDLERLAERIVALDSSNFRSDPSTRYFIHIYFAREDCELDLQDKGRSVSMLSHNPVRILVRIGKGTTEIYGMVPAKRTKRACFLSHVEEFSYKYYLFKGSETEQRLHDLVTYEESTGTVRVRQYQISNKYRTIPGIVWRLTRAFLLAGGRSPWSSIPGLQNVVVQLVDERGASLGTVEMSRRARDLGVRVYRRNDVYERIAAFYEPYFKVLLRRRAGLATEAEVKAAEKAHAEAIYRLYEEVWLEAAAGMRVQFNDGLSREVPPSIPY